MKQLTYKISIHLAFFIMLLMPQFVYAASPTSPVLTEVNAVDIKLSYDQNTNQYRVYARPNIDFQIPHYFLAAQITIRAEHKAETTLNPTAIVGALAGSDWAVTSRVDRPVESLDFDYISFTFEPSADVSQAKHEWNAGEEVLLFAFTNSSCTEASLMTITDKFYQPVAAGGFNSAYTDPSNSLVMAAVGGSYLNELTVGVYGDNKVNCQKEVVDSPPSNTEGSPVNNEQRLYLPIIIH